MTLIGRSPFFAGAALVLALVGAACASEPSGNVAKGEAKGDAIEVVIEDGSFEPDVLELAAGEEVTVEVRNDDGTAHDFAIESLDLNTGLLEPGEIATATFTVPEGRTEWVCTLHGGMDGVIET